MGIGVAVEAPLWESGFPAFEVNETVGLVTVFAVLMKVLWNWTLSTFAWPLVNVQLAALVSVVAVAGKRKPTSSTVTWSVQFPPVVVVRETVPVWVKMAVVVAVVRIEEGLVVGDLEIAERRIGRG